MRPARIARRLLAALLALAAACRSGPEDAAEPAPESLSLIWISLDTLRADHLGAYGYRRDTSPFLDELARRGLLFEWAVSPQNSTLPTHVTMFSGHHPVVHGVMHSRRNPGIALAPSVRTLPEILRDAGFATRAWVDGGKMKGHYGFARGFEAYQDRRAPLPRQLDAALAALDELPAGRRFFFLIHTYQIHAPYRPPPPYDALFATSGEAAEDPVRSRDLYDGSIRFVDDELRRFVAALEERGRLAHTVLVVTGDHGESFAEYGIPEVGHDGHNLHQNITRVPWILLHPGREHRGRVAETVGLIDFPNTLLARLGIAERLTGGGVDVLGPGRGGARPYLSTSGEAWSLYEDGYHLLESGEHPGPERNALFHVASDPREEQEARDPARRAQLRGRLAELRGELQRESRELGPRLQRRRALPASTRAELEALGYAVDDAAPAEPAAGSGQSVRNAILYLIDTLRADHLGAYGYGRPTSPALDALAARGVLFERCFTHDTRTVGAVPSLLTSRHPPAHGVERYGEKIRPDLVTLAEALSRAGWRTAAFVTNVNAGTLPGLERGFQHHRQVASRARDRTALRSLPEPDFFAWLDQQGGAPFFAYVHTAEPHRPYAPGPPFDSLFDPGYRGDVTGLFDGEGGYARATSPEDVAHVVALYDGEVRLADEALGRLLAGLEARGLRESTLVAVTSDHGEELHERGGWNHGHSLYDELLRVPLVLAAPRLLPEGARVAEPVALVDVAPTILALLGVPAPESFDGESLAGLAAGRPSERERFAARPVFARTSKPPEQLAVVQGRMKAILRPGGALELYDLAADPGERRDLAGEQPELARELRTRAEEWARVQRARKGEGRAAPLSPEERAELDALGYLEK